MKFIILFVFVGCTFTSYGQCNPYFNIREGMTWEYDTFNPDGELIKTIQARVVSYEELDSSGWVAGIDFQYGNGESEIHTGSVETKCENGIFYNSFGRFLTGSIFKDSDSLSSDIKSTDIQWPSTLNVGDKLPDASLLIDAGNMKAGMELTGRQVTSIDTVNIPLGKYVAYRVEYNLTILGLKEEKLKGVDYITEDIAVIRSEILDKNGDLRQYSVITKITGY